MSVKKNKKQAKSNIISLKKEKDKRKKAISAKNLKAKTAVKKTTTKKTVTKKTTAKKSVTKKAVAKKSVTKKAVAKKSVKKALKAKPLAKVAVKNKISAPEKIAVAQLGTLGKNRKNPFPKKENIDFSKLNLKQKNKIILEYHPLISFVAHKIHRRLPANVDVNDLISCGVIGLMDAVEKYDFKKDSQFKTYAEFRIRGAMLDDLRSQDWVPRSIREKRKKVERVINSLTNTLGRKPRVSEVANSLGMEEGEAHTYVSAASPSALISLDEMTQAPDFKGRSFSKKAGAQENKNNPQNQIFERNFKKNLSDKIGLLSKKEQYIVKNYYFGDLTLRQISVDLSLTESRISQIHLEALRKIQDSLEGSVNVEAFLREVA